MDKNTELKQSIAKRLSMARQNAGLSQGQAAVLMDMHRPTISEIEAGRRNVSVTELSRFSEVYGVDQGWLSCSNDTEVDENRDLIKLAARELSKLRKEDLDKVIQLLSVLRRDKEKKR